MPQIKYTPSPQIIRALVSSATWPVTDTRPANGGNEPRRAELPPSTAPMWVGATRRLPL